MKDKKPTKGESVTIQLDMSKQPTTAEVAAKFGGYDKLLSAIEDATPKIQMPPQWIIDVNNYCTQQDITPEQLIEEHKHFKETSIELLNKAVHEK